MKITACKKSKTGEQEQGKLVFQDTMFPNKISAAEFEKEVLQNTLPVLVIFYTTWCIPCRRIMPMARNFYSTHKDRIKICSMNLEHESFPVEKYGIRGIPTFIIFHQGKVSDFFIGADEKLFQRNMKKFLHKMERR